MARCGPASNRFEEEEPLSTLDLTPAEAVVLLEPNQYSGKDAVKASLMWLLAHKAIAIRTEKSSGFFGGNTTTVTAIAPPPGLQSDLATIYDLVARSAPCEMPAFAKSAQARFGTDLRGILHDHARPALMKRGLVVAKVEPFLFFFKRTRHYLTDQGGALLKALSTRIEQARSAAASGTLSRAEIAALALSLGGLIFLLPDLRQFYRDYAASLSQGGIDHTDSSTGSSSWPSSSSDPSGPSDEAPADIGDGDFGSALDSADAGFDAFDSAMSDLDAGFDSGFSSDGGGSDSGGGDSGGGGSGD